jgi:5-methylcytosine-specific restriction endonuclease McrA
VPVYLALHPRCVRCGLESNQVHHKAGREGELLLMEEHWAALCDHCHRWVTNNGKAAAAEGLKYEIKPKRERNA